MYPKSTSQTKRAAYIQQGMHQYPRDSHAHQTQSNQSTFFLESFKHLLKVTIQRSPSAHTDKTFARCLDSFMEILDGEGEYNQIVKGEGIPSFANFQDDLADPRKYANMVPSYYVISKKL